MTTLSRIALIGNALPRRCGIATFTTDLQKALAATLPHVETAIVAMNDSDNTYAYPQTVRVTVRDDMIADYAAAAAALNSARFDVVSLQHEFGIFGGDAGEHVMTLLSRLEMPVVTTFHTVLASPTPQQLRVSAAIIDASAHVVVMAEKGRALLQDVYHVPSDRISVIPHGIPDAPFVPADEAKARLGFTGRDVILTFGLLSPNKGIEVMIDAMPEILTHAPDAIYVVLGATHPNLVRREGERYRETLIARAKDLGIASRVVFLDRFVDQETLLGYIAMCDVYVTPYLNEAQMTSGTLANSFGLGKAIVSTPYWHARELLDDGRGVIVPFGDSAATAREVAALLRDRTRRDAMGERAYAASRSMTWPRIAERYREVLASAHDAQPRPHASPFARPAAARSTPPAMRTAYLLSLCDDTGLFQHAVHTVPDRSHGYCVDDNARALLVAYALDAEGEKPLPHNTTTSFVAFLQHAWNPDTKRFRNFLGFDRQWREPAGSEDSHGRTLWALGACSCSDPDPARRAWAADLFVRSLPCVEWFHSPRAWSFALLGIERFFAADHHDEAAHRLRAVLAARLMALLAAVETKDWIWFEEGLSYDNARLPQALIVTGAALGYPAMVDAGLRSLRWLMVQQIAPSGCFRPVGTDGFSFVRQAPARFDQQPVEVAATVSACLAAWRADGDACWRDHASRAFSWFLGQNDLAIPVVDIESGCCRDGLHWDRSNANCGGESAVSYLLALAELRVLARISGDRTRPALRVAISA
ncbi:glycosyltransferase family 4 protein [Elioraea rosea]|uniref:glycosyltransferase family 4 protein n=1 Tax=Elioraea rosea TaxID=2492390 RepID=UPI001186C62C|nr:glycosyltransferase family 4 protein [Elioraea rosea]